MRMLCLPRVPAATVAVAVVAAMMMAVSVAVTGCANPAAGNATSPDPPAFKPTAMPQAVAPLGPFGGLTEQSPAQTADLQTAQNILVSQCMAQRSYTYQATKPPVPVDAAATTGVYDLLSQTTAVIQGYGIADNATINQAEEHAGASTQPGAAKPGFSAALTGSEQHRVTLDIVGGSTVSFDSDGCVTTAVDELYGDGWNQAYFDLDGLSTKIEQQVEASPAWQTAMGQWQKCMRTRFSVTFTSPQAARSQVSDTASGALQGVSTATAKTRLGDIRQGEVKLATQDAICQQAIGLAAAIQSAQTQAEGNDQQTYSQEISTYTADLTHAEQMAATLLKQ